MKELFRDLNYNTKSKSVHKALLTLLFIALLSPFSYAQFTYTTSWLGNTWGTGDNNNNGEWVQLNSSSLYVAPDGTCYTNSYWEEGHRATQMYKDGQIAGRLDDNSIGQHGAVGGTEITGDGTYIWAHVDDWSSPPTIKRFNMNGSPANWTDGLGNSTNTIVYKDSHEIHGLSVDKTNEKLYVSLSTSDTVLVYNTTNLNSAPSVIKMTRPGRSIVASDGSLWILQEANSTNQAKILHFSSSRALLSHQITGHANWSPTALCFDLSGRLMVADNGPEQNIKIYTNLSNASPTLSGTFGNSIYSGTSGEVTDDKFGSSGLVGIGIDSNGNIYTALNGSDPYTAVDHGMGFVLESRTSSNALNWRLLGLEFVDNADVDKSSVSGDIMDVYTKDSRYTLDLSKKVAGTEWTYKAHTVDGFKYPQDRRVTDMPGNWRHVSNAWVRTIGGEKILFVGDMHGDNLRIFRFNYATHGEIAIPCGNISKKEIWYDSNGNGNQDSGETSDASLPGGGEDAVSTDIDSNGDIWSAHNGGAKSGIRQLIFQGIDANGVPKWSAANSNYVDAKIDLAPFGEVKRVIYVPEEDALYVTGYATSVDPDHYYQGANWGKKWLGSVVGRYDNWGEGNRSVKWTNVLPEYYGGPISIAVAGDYYFIGYAFFGSHGKEGTVRAFKKSDGSLVGTFRAGPEVSESSGTMDIVYGINAYKRANGEYIIFSEEDWHAKVLMYRWTPDDPNDTVAPSTPTALSSTGTTGNSVSLSWTASTDNYGIRQYEIFVDGVSAGTSPTNSFTVKELNCNTAYSFAVRARDAGGNYSAKSSAISVSTSSTCVVPEGVDLIVSDITWTPANPTTGDGVTFSAVVKNQGTAATPEGTIIGVAFQVNGATVAWSDVNSTSLAGGATRTLTANGGVNGAAWTAGANGNYTILANVDDVRRISEANDGNNTRSETLVVGGVTLRDPENPSNTVGGLDYNYYEGTWDALPNFSTLTAVKSGTSSGFDISVRNQEDNFAFAYTGYVTIPSDGWYTFYTSSDDGSKLYIGSSQVVNNDGLHGVVEARGAIGLKAGKHAIRVTFFEATGGQSLAVSYSSASISKTPIPATALSRASTGFSGDYKIIARHSGKALEVANASTANGGNVQQMAYTGAANQIWNITSDGNDFYTLRAKHSGKVLDVNGGVSATDNEDNIHQWDDFGADNQLWSIESVGEGYFKLLAKHSGKALDVSGPSTADGANIHQWEYLSGTNQQWQFTAVTSSSSSSSSARQALKQEEVSETSFNLFPMPVINNELNINFYSESNQQINIDFTSLQGSKIKGVSKSVSEGMNSFSVDVQDIKNGIYLLTLHSSHKRIIKKIIIAR